MTSSCPNLCRNVHAFAAWLNWNCPYNMLLLLLPPPLLGATGKGKGREMATTSSLPETCGLARPIRGIDWVQMRDATRCYEIRLFAERT